jgi:hypothetical protein
MCTVSFIPAGGTVYLTSNRDEQASRAPAAPPAEHHGLLFPRDGQKGGTWVAMDGKGKAAVLLNGALHPHPPSPAYTQSRGLVIPSLLREEDPIAAFDRLPLEATEPFTLVLYTGGRLFVCRWNGREKTVEESDARKPQLWSSATLYTTEVMERRRQWFRDWLKKHPHPDAEAILSFHREGGKGDSENGLVMNRSGHTLTQSITLIAIRRKGSAYAEASADREGRNRSTYANASVDAGGSGGCMHYLDLKGGRRYRKKAPSKTKPYKHLRERWRRFKIRLLNWEYWPFHLLYAPVFLYYFYLAAKARSFFFFNAANPTIRNGGFLMESKKEIYDLLPPGTYPTTLLVPFGKLNNEALISEAVEAGLHFPIIAKPDIGLRGLGVKKLRTVEELLQYHRESRVDYLLQAFVPYEKELGVFYCRMPGERKGKITGLVGKDLLTVTGDGIHTLEELLGREDRFYLQLPSLRMQKDLELSEVLPEGVEKLIVPYGNHSRGARFVDLTSSLTPALAEKLEALCEAVPGFYFGRLDIKYQSWEALCRGEAFSVIELNGAGSEPAHIYDPKHSLLFAWKEIIRHLRLLYLISQRNKTLGRGGYLSFSKGVQLFRENGAHVEKIS